MKWEYGSVSLNMFLVRDFDTYKTNVCDRAPKLEADKEAGKMSYFQYAFKNFAAYTRARPSVEPNVLDLLVEHEHKSLLTTLPLVQGLLDHKWQTFGRQLLSTWFVIIAIVFIIFEVNVYRAADQTAQEFTELEYVSGALVWPVLQYQHPKPISRQIGRFKSALLLHYLSELSGTWLTLAFLPLTTKVNVEYP